MAFQEKLQVEIETIFNSAGFDKLQAELKQTKAQMAATFGQVQQLRGLRREAERFAGVMEQAGLGERQGSGAPFFDMETGAPVDAANATERMADAMDRASVVSAGFSENVTEGAGALQEAQEMAQGMRLPFNQDNRRIADVVPQGNQDPMGMNRIRSMNMPQTRSLFASSGITRFNLSLGRLSELSSISRIQLRKLANSAMGLAGRMRAAAAGTQQLQMRLLGLQFTMMTIAFIFGGLMMSALGAVGVFKVLGNTLKFLFLPTALNVLDGVLGIQEAIMNMDKSTRRLIGDIVFWISVIAGVIAIFAVLGKGIITVVSIMSTLGSWIVTIIEFIAGGLSGAIAGVIAGFVGAFAAVHAAFKLFGNVVGSIVTVIFVLAGALLAVAGFFVSIPALIAAGIAIILGAIVAFVWNMRDQIVALIKGLVSALLGIGKSIYNALIKPFVDAFRALVGNSIIPKMVNKILGWLMKLPKAALSIGSKIVNSIVKGIKGIGNGIWNALKSVLPDFIVDALEGAAGMVGGALSTAGNVAGGIANTVGNLAGGVANAAGNLASGVANTVGGFFGGGGNKAGTTNVQNNQINAQVQVNGPEETPQETGRKFGQGLAQGLNNKTSNISSGT